MSEHVLVVEDEESYRDSLRHIFEREGFRVTLAATGRQGVEAFERHGADVILLAKNIDGVYSADPKVDPNAVKFDSISYDEVLARKLAVMDSTATSLSMDNHIPVILFALEDPENILRVILGEKIGTIVG